MSSASNVGQPFRALLHWSIPSRADGSELDGDVQLKVPSTKLGGLVGGRARSILSGWDQNLTGGGVMPNVGDQIELASKKAGQEIRRNTGIKVGGSMLTVCGHEEMSRCSCPGQAR